MENNKNIHLKIEYIDIDKLTPYSRNSKIHTREQISHIVRSIREFGMNDPLGISGEDNIILEGNGRLEALRQLGYTKAPCLRLDHMKLDQRRAYVIAHNHINQQTGFNQTILLAELEELQGKVDMAALGVLSEEYLSTLKDLEQQQLRQYSKVHYMISMNVDLHDTIIPIIDQLRVMEGVQIESTLN